MRNALFRIGSEFIYRIHAQGRHSIHSPRVYGWLDALKNDRGGALSPKSFRRIAREMKWGGKNLAFTDYGTGSDRTINLKKWGENATSSRSKRRFIQALVRALKSTYILEMGTALGTTTADLARIHQNLSITTIEGDSGLLHCARDYWDREGISNALEKSLPIENGTHRRESPHQPTQITAYCGPFIEIMPQLPLETFDLVIIDGDHRGSSIQHWAHWIADRAPNTFLLIDDIRWSRDMWDGWNALCKDPRWLLTIDFGQMGLLTPARERVKEHFVLRKYVS
jgi:hypothetical protein